MTAKKSGVFIVTVSMVLVLFFFVSPRGAKADMNQYCIQPPWINQAASPLVMLVTSRDEKLFYKGYNDLIDLNNDGVIDSTYNDAIDYYGYYHPNLCYDYSSSRFEPSAAASGTNNHYCTGKWSGNFLNWAAMARIDILRKALYGGKRKVDTDSLTVLSRTVLPRDAHSWVKAYNGSDISSLTPVTWSSITLCNTNTSDSETSGQIFAIRGFFPYAASTEVKQCVKTYEGGSNLVSVTSLGLADTDGKYVPFNADVKVCVTGVGLETNCEAYGSTYKPSGLIQRFGINRLGPGNPPPMYFGLISGSYGANVSGGVLRSNIVDIGTTEIDTATGLIKSGSKIIKNIDRFQVAEYNFSSGWYDACKPSEPYTPTNGFCKSWGNPVGEMFYEAARYFQGRRTPTTQYQPASPDGGLYGLTVESSWCDPYATDGSCTAFPYCAKPFVILLSDTFPSFDSDHLPGSNWAATISTSDVPSVQTLISNSGINSIETLGDIFIGQSGSGTDRQCTPKSSSNFGTIRGLCVEEPTKQGSFYIAGLANYGRTVDQRSASVGASAIAGDQKINTYAIATESIPPIDVSVGGSTVRIVPTFHDGCPNTNLAGCTYLGQGGDNSKGRLVFMRVCPNDADWQSEQLAGYAMCYDVMWDDAEYGWDYDLDTSLRHYIKTTASTLTVKTKALYANAGHTGYAGYFISGVSGAGTYYETKCGGSGVNTKCQLANSSAAFVTPPVSNERTFSVSGATAGILKDPLWYAAKYGGFDDSNENGTPDVQNEWDKDSDGIPDNYFYASNPLKLEELLSTALTDILRRTSSGTAASILASSEGSGANLLQAVFYPKRMFGLTEIQWTGEVQNLWYYIDPTLQNSTIREDTPTSDRILSLTGDRILDFYFDDDMNKTMVRRYNSNSDGSKGSYVNSVAFENIYNIWAAGELLWAKSPSSRTIYTTINGSSLLTNGFATTNASALRPFLQASDDTESAKIINFIRGTDQTGYRNRSVRIGSNTNVWKLGDIVSSTPRLQSTVPLNMYHLLPPDGYNDTTYLAFTKTTSYKNRGMVYFGANDGMLHALKLGKFEQIMSNVNPERKAQLTGESLGTEEWAFIPRHSLPYLKYLTDPRYCHLYYLDLPPSIVDASIGSSSDGATTVKTSGSWRTVLVGGMGLGGACKKTTDATCATCVKTPIEISDEGVGYSSYFALDVTDPASPSLMWEFSHPDMGMSTSGPAFVRIGDRDKNGKWFVVVASGPTGPVDPDWHQFKGESEQNLKLFAIDLKTGSSTVIDTGIANAFGGSLAGATLDADRGNASSTGFYSDEAIYLGYTKKSDGVWRKGGVLRVVTKEDMNPANWVVSNVITDIGPVTSAIAKLQDRQNKNLWLYFGSGRFFYKYGNTSGGNTAYIDDADGQQVLYGIKEPCYATVTRGLANEIDPDCTASASVLTNRTTVSTGDESSVPLSGWYINLDPSETVAGYKAERVITDPLAAFSGVVFFTSFSPSGEICALGGNTYLWAVKYNTGTAGTASALQGRAILQISTGEIKDLKMPEIFTANSGRKSASIQGLPPKGQGLSIILRPKPIKKIIHIQEK